MFRTRDFILVFVIVIFLVLSIGATVIQKNMNALEATTPITFTDVNNQEYVAETYKPDGLSRAERVEAMRKKIASSETVILSAAEPEPELESLGTTTEPNERSLGVQLCSNYSPYMSTWNSQGLQIELVEGARIVYQEVLVSTPEIVSSTTETQSPQRDRDVLLQLPANPFILGAESCIATDVVGVAQDGSLIRNNESGLYGVFGDQTLIGYALDGHPIYGTTDRELDVCGGAEQAGLYGYYLSTDSETILNCFVSLPVSFTNTP
jgi:hypothetical protein